MAKRLAKLLSQQPKGNQMPRTIEHIVAVSDLAHERRDAGKPMWDRRIAIDLSDKPTFKKRRNEWARAIKASGWLGDESSDNWQIWDEMKDAETEDHFNTCLDALYDEADYDRVWITVKH